MRLSLIIPAFNEAAKITRDLDAAHEFLIEQPFASEILVVNDGSRDTTQEVAQNYAREHGTERVAIRVLSYERNRGKGYAVRFGVGQAQGERVAFMDAGLCVPLPYLLKGLDQIDRGADYAIGSRRLPGTRILRPQPFYRRVGSKVFWLVIQTGMGVRVSDTQCGFKIYSQKAAREIFNRVKTDGFMFDIEALVIAHKLGLKVAEFAVEWANDSDTRYHPFWGTLRNFKELMEIRLRKI